MLTTTGLHTRVCQFLPVIALTLVPAQLAAQAGGASLADLQSLVQRGQAIVVTDTTNHKIKGTFIGVAGDVLLVAVPEERHIAADTIAKVQRADPIWNGAVIGAVVMGGWCAFVCGQGVDSRNQWLPVVAANAGFGALIGLGVDALSGSRTLLQRASPVVTATRRATASLSFTLRF
jgi:hypothetical protein